MDPRRVAKLLGILMMFVAGCMATSIPWALYYGESATVWAFVESAGLTFVFGAALAAGDGILFVGAPGDRAGSVDGAGTAAAVTPTTADTVHVPVGESAVGSTVPVGSYRSQVPTGTCAITTRTADDAIRSVMVAKDGSGYLQVTPDDNEVSVSAGCNGVWFLTPR